jgi:hypothetical protein
VNKGIFAGPRYPAKRELWQGPYKGPCQTPTKTTFVLCFLSELFRRTFSHQAKNEKMRSAALEFTSAAALI